MTVLAQNTPMSVELGDYNDLPAAAVNIYEGAMCFLNVSGYVTSVIADGRIFVGHAFGQCDNSAGSAGDLNVRLRAMPYLAQVTLSGVAVTSIGQPVYATDNATLSLTEGEYVGRVWRYVSSGVAVVLFEPFNVEGVASDMLRAGLTPELAHDDTADFLLIPSFANRTGLVIQSIYARVTEAMAGSSEDQMIITVYDESNNSLATLTPTDGAADAIGDIVVGYQIQAASTGDALKTVAAGEFVDCKVTQATAGTPAGQMVVYIDAVPLT